MSLPSPQGVVLVSVLVALASVVVSDIRSRRIPNAVVVAVALGGVLHAALVSGFMGAAAAIVGILAGVALLSLQFKRGLMGAGDVKLLGAIGAWTGALGAVYVILGASLLGGVLALVALLRLEREERACVWANLWGVVLTRDLTAAAPSAASRRRGIPFGVALSAVGAAMLLWRGMP